MKKQAKIRVKVLAWIENNGNLFVARMHDNVKGDDYYRPIGGSVEFGETTTTALHREVKEELDTEILITGQPLVLENIFTCDGQSGHEIDYLYPARFIDSKFYAREVFPLVEDNIKTFDATWIDLDSFLRGDLRLVPEGLLELYRRRSQSS
jgi:ADP-ribose pyrophosphatase YjhB (NUDIX family)